MEVGIEFFWFLKLREKSILEMSPRSLDNVFATLGSEYSLLTGTGLWVSVRVFVPQCSQRGGSHVPGHLLIQGHTVQGKKKRQYEIFIELILSKAKDLPSFLRLRSSCIFVCRLSFLKQKDSIATCIFNHLFWAKQKLIKPYINLSIKKMSPWHSHSRYNFRTA